MDTKVTAETDSLPDDVSPKPVLSEAALRWQAEHGAALQALDDWIDEHGMPLAYLRDG